MFSQAGGDGWMIAWERECFTKVRRGDLMTTGSDDSLKGDLVASWAMLVNKVMGE